MKRLPLSAMLTSLPLDFEPAVRCVAELGFSHVDVVALAERPDAHREVLAETGLLVACASLARASGGAWAGCPSRAVRQASLDIMKRQLADAATLGATRAYVVPPVDTSPDALGRFAEGCSLLAEHGASRMVRVCVEPVPGRAIATAAAMLEWLDAPERQHLSLLLDVGHCLISGEGPAEIVRRAGRRLGYVHLDDNDGIGDLHWPLLAGQLTRGVLERFLASLDETGYDGTLAFEFHPQLVDPLAALRAGKRLLEELGQGSTERPA